MASTEQTMVAFFKKTERDEGIMRSRYPQIAGIGQVAPVPLAVLHNYNVARNDVQQRVVFVRDLLREYVDPTTGEKTPDPVPLPRFGVREGGGTFSGLGDAEALNAIQRLAAMVQENPKALIPARDIVFDTLPPLPPSPQQGLGFAPVPILVFGLVIAVGGLAAALVISKITQEKVKLAQAEVEFARQANFARVWDTAQELLTQCLGPAPSPQRVAECWNNVAARVPELTKAIPEQQFQPEGGLFSRLGMIAAGVGVVFLGVWGYRRWKESQDKKEDRERRLSMEERESRARISAMAPADAPTMPAMRSRSRKTSARA